LPHAIKHLAFLLLFSVFFKTEAFSFVPKDSVQYYLSESKKHAYDNFPKAEIYLKKAEAVAQKSKDENLIADVAHNFGATYYISGSYEIALQKFMEALLLYERNNNKFGIMKCLMGQGLIQQGIGRNDEAIKLFKKSIVLNNELKDTVFLSKNYLNIGISQSELLQFNDAYYNFHKSLKLATKTKNHEMQHLSWNRLGNIHYLKNQPDSSVYYFKKVIDDKTSNLWEKSFAFSGLSETFLKKGDYVLAEEFGLKGYQIALKINAKWDIARSSEILAKTYKEDRKFESAYKYLEISKAYNDSLFNDSKLKEINLLQLKRKEAENEKLVAQNESARHKLNNIKLFVISIVLFMLFLLIILNQYRRNNKVSQDLYRQLELKNLDIKNRKAVIKEQNQVLNELNTTKNKLFSILSHDLKAPINSIQQVLALLKDGDVSDDELKILTEHLVTQVDGTSIMLNTILQWSMTQLDGANIYLENLNLDIIVKDSIRSLYLTAKSKEIEVIHIEKGDIFINADNGNAHIIINNLLSNALKYTPKNGLIEIKYSEEKSLLNIHIINSGSGISEAKIEEILNFDQRMISEKGTGLEEGTGLGLLLVKQFLIENNGKLDIIYHPEGGTEFVASFQKAK
jgi:signal transduction histidine kinase